MINVERETKVKVTVDGGHELIVGKTYLFECHCSVMCGEFKGVTQHGSLDFESLKCYFRVRPDSIKQIVEVDVNEIN